jgi:predicted ATPase
VQHRQLATRFGQDIRVAILSWRALALWLLGYPDTALADVDQAVSNARENSQPATLIYALIITPMTALHCGNFAAASTHLAEGIALADEKSTMFFKAGGTCLQGCILALSGEVSNSIKLITSGLEEWRATGATLFVPLYLSNLARAYAEPGRSDEARRCINEAIGTIETTKERCFEAEANRLAGEIALLAKRDCGQGGWLLRV